MPHHLFPGAFVPTASLWMPAPALHMLDLDASILESLPPILMVAVGVVALLLLLLVIVLLVRRGHRRRAQRPRPPLPREALELYDLHTAGLTEEIRFCVELARAVGGPVLELGAGTGRITLELARRGLLVTGLEPSPGRLSWAKTRIERFSAKRRVEWVEGPLTSFSLGGRKFKLILAPFNTLEEVHDLTDLERCLHAVADHLDPDGIFVAIVQPPRWEARSGERRYVTTLYNPRTGEIVNSYQSLEVDPIWHQMSGIDTHEIWDQRGQRREVVAPFAGSYLTCPQMALLLRAARMHLEAVYGSFAREPLTLQSHQMIFVARLRSRATRPVPTEQPALAGAAAARIASGVPGIIAAQPGVSPAAVTTSRAASGNGDSLAVSQPAHAPLGASASGDATAPEGVSLARGVPSSSEMPPGRSNNGSQRSSQPKH